MLQSTKISENPPYYVSSRVYNRYILRIVHVLVVYYYVHNICYSACDSVHPHFVLTNTITELIFLKYTLCA